MILLLALITVVTAFIPGGYFLIPLGLVFAVWGLQRRRA